MICDVFNVNSGLHVRDDTEWLNYSWKLVHYFEYINTYQLRIFNPEYHIKSYIKSQNDKKI